MSAGAGKSSGSLSSVSTALLLVLASFVFFGFLVIAVRFGSIGLPIPSVSRYRLVSVGVTFCAFLAAIGYPFWPIAKSIYRREGVPAGLGPIGRMGAKTLFGFGAWAMVMGALMRADPSIAHTAKVGAQFPEVGVKAFFILLGAAVLLAVLLGIGVGLLWLLAGFFGAKAKVPIRERLCGALRVAARWAVFAAVFEIFGVLFLWSLGTIDRQLPGGFWSFWATQYAPDYLIWAPVQFQVVLFVVYLVQVGGLDRALANNDDAPSSSDSSGPVLRVLSEEGRLFLLAFCSSAIGLILVFYSLAIFPRLPPYLGGGRPLTVEIVGDASPLGQVVRKPFELLELGDDVVVRDPDGGQLVVVAKSKLGAIRLFQMPEALDAGSPTPELDGGVPMGQ